VIPIGDLHIYQIEGMEEYIPKKIYYGDAGRIQSFLDSMSDWLYPEADSQYFKTKRTQSYMKLFNAARELSLLDMKMNLVIKKMNWYVEKIIELITNGKCNYNGYCIFLSCDVFDYKDGIEIEVEDCNDDIFKKEYKVNYKTFIKEPNYLKRDYSDKLLAYVCNLLELYEIYFGGTGFSIHMNGDKCFGGRGYIEWS
jgi:hypothetical protein